MKQQYLLSIDQGTTGTTVSLINTKGQLKVKGNREFRQIFPKPGWVEHDPKDIWKSLRLSIKEVFEKSEVNPKSVIAIGITNQRETVVAWDKKTGETIGNAIVWQCRRTTDFCEKLKKKGVEKSLQKTTGLVLDPYFSGTKMHWILRNNPEAKALTKKNQLALGTIDAYLIWKLTGGKSFMTDVTNASRTQLMSLDTLSYDPGLLKLFSLKENMLAQIKASGDHFGKTARVAGLPSGIPITGVLGDQQSALFGQYCFEKGEAKITFGTGSFLLMNTGSKKVMSQKGLLTTVGWQWPGAKEASYALEGGAFICGAAVQWLRDNMHLIHNSPDIEKLAKKVEDSGGVEFVPAFSGLGAPHWDPLVRGTMFGLTRGTTNEHIARATLEAMALQNVDIMNTMVGESKVKLKTVRVDGGAAANNLLMQLQADYLGVGVVRPKNVETTSLGAALMAGLAEGVWSDKKDLRKMDKVDKTFKHRSSATERAKRLKRWHKAVDSMQAYYQSVR
jgi:glycerol kinase